jgi:hypothetical protein
MHITEDPPNTGNTSVIVCDNGHNRVSLIVTFKVIKFFVCGYRRLSQRACN